MIQPSAAWTRILRRPGLFFLTILPGAMAAPAAEFTDRALLRAGGKMQVVWSEGSVEDRISIGNACPVCDSDTGRLWCAFTRKNPRVFVTHSDDDGRTWARPQEITSQVRPMEWTRYWTGPGHGLQLKH